MLNSLLGGATTWVTQYVVYILGAAVAASLLFGGVQTVRLVMAQKDVKAANAERDTKIVELKQRDAVIEQLAAKSAEVAKRFEQASATQVATQKRHQKELAELIKRKFPAECNEAAAFTIENVPELIPVAWR